MNTTNFGAEPGTALDPDVICRSITAGGLQTAASTGIIVWELATALVLIYATVLWLTAWSARTLEAPRPMLVILTIGGEWFQMWRSESWNRLQPTLQNSALALLGLILIHLPSPL